MFSPVVHKLLCGRFLERNQKTIEICDVDERDFRAVLDLWCGKADCECKGLEDVLQLASIADRFEITDVSLALEAVILRHLTVQNCCELLTWSSRNGLRMLQSAARCLALERFAELAGTVGFAQIDEDVLESLLCDDELVMTGEEAVFEAVVEWFKAAERSHTSVKLLRSIRPLQLSNIDGFFESTYLKWIAGYSDLIQDFADDVVRSNSHEYFIDVSIDESSEFQLAQPYTDSNLLEAGALVLAKYYGAWFTGRVETTAADRQVLVVFKGYENEGPVATDASEVTPNRAVLAKKYGDDCQWLKGQVVGTDDEWVLVLFDGDGDEPQETDPKDVRVVLNNGLDDDEHASIDSEEFKACAQGIIPAALWLLLGTASAHPRDNRRRRINVDWAHWVEGEGKCIHIWGGTLAMAECEQQICIGSSAGKLTCWSVKTHECEWQLHDGSSAITALAVWQGRLVSAHESGRLRVWNVRTGACEQVVEAEAYGEPRVCAFVVAGTRLAGGCADGTIMFWTSGAALPLVLEGTVRRGTAAVSALAAWRGTVLSGHRDGAIRVWEGVGCGGGTTLSCRYAVTALAVHGDVLYSATADGMIQEWEVGSWAPLRTARGCQPKQPGEYNLCLAVSGSKLVVGSNAAAECPIFYQPHEVRRGSVLMLSRALTVEKGVPAQRVRATAAVRPLTLRLRSGRCAC
jgi:hypothetical protein